MKSSRKSGNRVNPLLQTCNEFLTKHSKSLPTCFFSEKGARKAPRAAGGPKFFDFCHLARLVVKRVFFGFWYLLQQEHMKLGSVFFPSKSAKNRKKKVVPREENTEFATFKR